MPNGYVCYDPPGYAPAVGPLPALRKGHVTFGSFNNPGKISPEVAATWARILNRLPDSRLMLKFHNMGRPAMRRRYTEMFAAHGIAPERVEILGVSEHPALLDHYNRVDVALDPFPYCGGLTTCEACGWACRWSLVLARPSPAGTR